VAEPTARGDAGPSPATLCVANVDTTSSAPIRMVRPAFVTVKLSAARLVLTKNPPSLNYVPGAVRMLENATGT
jgi:hypothetical protein